MKRLFIRHVYQKNPNPGLDGAAGGFKGSASFFVALILAADPLAGKDGAWPTPNTQAAKCERSGDSKKRFEMEINAIMSAMTLRVDIHDDAVKRPGSMAMTAVSLLTMTCLSVPFPAVSISMMVSV